MSKIVQINLKRLETAARKKRATNTTIAQDAGLSRQSVWEIMKGRSQPTAINLKRICDVLELPIGEAFTEKAVAEN